MPMKVCRILVVQDIRNSIILLVPLVIIAGKGIHLGFHGILVQPKPIVAIVIIVLSQQKQVQLINVGQKKTEIEMFHTHVVLVL